MQNIGIISQKYKSPVVILTVFIWEFAANIAVLVFGLAYAYFRDKSGKVHMEVSYEEA